jgi:hypothetical protein
VYVERRKESLQLRVGLSTTAITESRFSLHDPLSSEPPAENSEDERDDDGVDADVNANRVDLDALAAAANAHQQPSVDVKMVRLPDRGQQLS